MEDKKTRAKRFVAMRRGAEGDRRRTRVRARRLVAMRRIGKDKSGMKYSDRYPRLIIRIGDELLGEMEKEIKKSGMNSSEITKKALSEYFERSTVEN